jgi:hypothetical protein
MNANYHRSELVGERAGSRGSHFHLLAPVSCCGALRHLLGLILRVAVEDLPLHLQIEVVLLVQAQVAVTVTHKQRFKKLAR